MEGDNAPSIRLPAILSPLLRGNFEDRPAQLQARDAPALRAMDPCFVIVTIAVQPHRLVSPRGGIDDDVFHRPDRGDLTLGDDVDLGIVQMMA